MIIKHFAGYGKINAKLISNTNGVIKIKVWGDHEQGLDRSAFYSDVYDWLVRRLCPQFKTIPYSYGMIAKCDYAFDGYVTGVESGLYTIHIDNSPRSW